MQYQKGLSRIQVALIMFLVPPVLSQAQTTGYISGTSSLTSFSATTGVVISSFASGGTGLPFAVASDDTTLYMTTDPEGSAGVLEVVSGQSGSTLDTLALGLAARKVVLSSDGAKAYVNASGSAGPEFPAGQVIVVDTATLSIIGSLTVRAGLTIGDIALSPDNGTLYVSINCFADETSCSKTGGACPVLKGICVYDASTLALKGKVNNLNGYMSVSQNGKSLYVNLVQGGFYIMDTSTLAITTRSLPSYPYGPVVVSPVGNFAMIFTSGNAQGSSSAYVLNTSTNKIVGEFFVDAPDGSQVGGSTIGRRRQRRSRLTGKSLWMLLTCGGSIPTCTLPYTPALAGVSFPSGKLISLTEMPFDAAAIAFPHPVTQ